MTDASNQVLLSAVVVWEVAIKRSAGKLDAPGDLAATLLGAGAQALPIGVHHAEAIGELLGRRSPCSLRRADVVVAA